MVIEAFKKRIGNYLVGRTIGEVRAVSYFQLRPYMCRQRASPFVLDAGYLRESKIR